MLFRLSYPPFYAYSKPNRQVACACHYFNRQQHIGVILMDNGIPVKRQGNHTRVIQFSKAIPMRVSAKSGWAAKRRHAAAMFE